LPAVAFFDLDRTLIPTHTSLLYLRAMAEEGAIHPFTMVRAGLFLGLYFLNVVDTEKVVRGVVRKARGTPDQPGRARGERVVAQRIIPRLSPDALARITFHRQAGHAVCILSAGPEYVVAPLARHLGVDAECTRFETRDGVLTGDLVGPPCYGAHKVEAARAYARSRGVPLARCHFYTDSASDLPLMEAVGFPVAINPDPRLSRVARARGWERWRW